MAFIATLAEAGDTTMLVSVWETVMVTGEVAVRLPASRMTTWKLYVPAAVKLAVVFLAALVPFAEKLTAAGGVPTVDQV